MTTLQDHCHFELIEDHTLLVITKDYRNPITPVINMPAPLEEGTVIFDLLLCNSYSPNRFIKGEIREGKYIWSSLEVMKEVPVDIINRVQRFFNENIELVVNSNILS